MKKKPFFWHVFTTLVSGKFRLFSTWRWRIKMEDAHGSTNWKFSIRIFPFDIFRDRKSIYLKIKNSIVKVIYFWSNAVSQNTPEGILFKSIVFQIKLSVQQLSQNIIVNIEKILVSFEWLILLKQVPNRYWCSIQE